MATSLEPNTGNADLHAGGRLARDTPAGSSSEEEEEWHDAQEELPSDAMPVADQTWWAQAGPEDVEQHLLKDTHEKGKSHEVACTCLRLAAAACIRQTA